MSVYKDKKVKTSRFKESVKRHHKAGTIVLALLFIFCVSFVSRYDILNLAPSTNIHDDSNEDTRAKMVRFNSQKHKQKQKDSSTDSSVSSLSHSEDSHDVKDNNKLKSEFVTEEDIDTTIDWKVVNSIKMDSDEDTDESIIHNNNNNMIKNKPQASTQVESQQEANTGEEEPRKSIISESASNTSKGKVKTTRTSKESSWRPERPWDRRVSTNSAVTPGPDANKDTDGNKGVNNYSDSARNKNMGKKDKVMVSTEDNQEDDETVGTTFPHREQDKRYLRMLQEEAAAQNA